MGSRVPLLFLSIHTRVESNPKQVSSPENSWQLSKLKILVPKNHANAHYGKDILPIHFSNRTSEENMLRIVITLRLVLCHLDWTHFSLNCSKTNHLYIGIEISMNLEPWLTRWELYPVANQAEAIVHCLKHITGKKDNIVPSFRVTTKLIS